MSRNSQFVAKMAPCLNQQVAAVRLQAAGHLRWSKQVLQNTGRPCLGTNGTLVGLSHDAQMTVVSSVDFPLKCLHFLQVFGSCMYCCLEKNSCSPALNVNSFPHTRQINSRSSNRMFSSFLDAELRNEAGTTALSPSCALHRFRSASGECLIVIW